MCSNQQYRGFPLGPSSLAFQIRSLIQTAILLSNHDNEHPTTLELNAAFLELVSQHNGRDIASLLKEWAMFLNSGQWGVTRLVLYDSDMLLNALVDYIKTGLSELIEMYGKNSVSVEQGIEFSRRVEGILRLIQGMRNKARKTLVERDLGRRMTDEEELVWLMESRI